MKQLLLTAMILAFVFAPNFRADFFQCPPSCIGSDNADVINGSDQPDSIGGGAGDDVIFGRAGFDSLVGEGDNDLIFGGPNWDAISGGPGNDTIFPGPEDDEFVQESHGGAGNDIFVVLVSETTNCQEIYGDQDFDVLHLIGFGPYILEYPYGAADIIDDNSWAVIQDPITGGFILANVGTIERITGLAIPSLTVVDNPTIGNFYDTNCSFVI